MAPGTREGEIRSLSCSEHWSGYAAAAGLQGAPGDERDLSAAPRNPRHLPRQLELHREPEFRAGWDGGWTWRRKV